MDNFTPKSQSWEGVDSRDEMEDRHQICFLHYTKPRCPQLWSLNTEEDWQANEEIELKQYT